MSGRPYTEVSNAAEFEKMWKRPPKKAALHETGFAARLAFTFRGLVAGWPVEVGKRLNYHFAK